MLDLRLYPKDQPQHRMLRAQCPTQIRTRIWSRVGGAGNCIRLINMADMAAVITTRTFLVVMIGGAKVVVTIPSGGVTTDLCARIGLLERGIIGVWSSAMDFRCVLTSASQ